MADSLYLNYDLVIHAILRDNPRLPDFMKMKLFTISLILAANRELFGAFQTSVITDEIIEYTHEMGAKLTRFLLAMAQIDQKLN